MDFEQIKCLKTALSEIPDGPLDALQKLDSILDSAIRFFAEIQVFWAVFTENELQWIEQNPYKIKDYIVLQKRRERREKGGA